MADHVAHSTPAKTRISRRDGLKLATAGLTASLPPTSSFSANPTKASSPSSRGQAKMIKDVKFVEIKGGPHGALWTHAEQVNAELVKCLA
jgi:hypothetical protein